MCYLSMSVTGHDMDGFVQDCSISIANALEILIDGLAC